MSVVYSIYMRSWFRFSNGASVASEEVGGPHSRVIIDHDFFNIVFLSIAMCTRTIILV